MNNIVLIIILAAIAISIIVVNLFPGLLNFRCPKCGNRSLKPSGGGKYSCVDIWGHKGGSYTIYTCTECEVAKVKHRKGMDDIEYKRKEDEALKIVFGETRDKSKDQITGRFT